MSAHVYHYNSKVKSVCFVFLMVQFHTVRAVTVVDSSAGFGYHIISSYAIPYRITGICAFLWEEKKKDVCPHIRFSSMGMRLQGSQRQKHTLVSHTCNSDPYHAS